MDKAQQTVTGKLGYRDIKREIFRRIRSNEWGPGTQLPGEVALAEEFGCARATVNRAMQELSDDGIIERRRKGGSHVKLAPVRQVKFEIPLVRVEIESKGAAYAYRLLSRSVDTAPRWLTKRLGLTPDAEVLRLKCLHLSNNTPYQFEDRWINLVTVPRARATDFSGISPNEWLVSQVPYTNAEVRFSATRADSGVAAALGVAEEAPVFLAQRTTWLAGSPVTHVRLHFPQSYEMVANY